jgi:hypothetical protein
MVAALVLASLGNCGKAVGVSFMGGEFAWCIATPGLVFHMSNGCRECNVASWRRRFR